MIPGERDFIRVASIVAKKKSRNFQNIAKFGGDIVLRPLSIKKILAVTLKNLINSNNKA